MTSKKQKMTTLSLSVYLSGKERLNQVSEHLGLSVSETARRALDYGLNQLVDEFAHDLEKQREAMDLFVKADREGRLIFDPIDEEDDENE